jgi:hypothetical protein
VHLRPFEHGHLRVRNGKLIVYKSDGVRGKLEYAARVGRKVGGQEVGSSPSKVPESQTIRRISYQCHSATCVACGGQLKETLVGPQRIIFDKQFLSDNDGRP